MTAELMTLLMFIGILVGVFMGFPIAFTLSGLGVLFGFIGWGDTVLSLLGSKGFAVMTNYTYVAIPLFVFMGCMLNSSGVADTAFEVLAQWLRKVKGGLGIATCILCIIFAACTGVVGASVTTMGLLVLGPMISKGYSKSLSTGLVAAGGTLGILIPPSIMLVVFGPIAGISVVQLFESAFVPGITLGICYALYVIIIGKVKPGVIPDVVADEHYEKKFTLLQGLKCFVPFILLILCVLGSIFFGIAAPTEAAGLGALGSILIAALYKTCTWKNLKDAAISTLETSAMVMYVAFGANMFTGVFFGVGGKNVVANTLASIGMGPTATLVLVLVIVFLLGMLIDWLGILLIVIPIFMPILTGFGYDPLWISMVIIVLLQTSFLSPPFAYALFYVKGVAPEGVTIGDIYRGVVPFILIQLAVLMICIFVPEFVTFMPDLLAQ